MLVFFFLSSTAVQSASINVGSGSFVDFGGAVVNHPDLSLENNGEVLLTSTMILLNSFSNQASGVIDVSSSVLSVFGDWENSGDFVGAGATVNLIDGNPVSRVSGDTVFHELLISTTVGKTITFESGSQTTVLNNLLLSGVNNNLLVINSDMAGEEALLSLDRNASQTIEFVDVTDNFATNQVIAPGEPSAYDSIQGNNVRGWFGVPLHLPVPSLGLIGQVMMALLFMLLFIYSDKRNRNLKGFK